MSALRDQLFLQFVNKGVTSLRSELREKYTPKKQSRFLIKGLTYEIGPCCLQSGKFVFEISSKIPQDALPKKVRIETYFNAVVKLMNKSAKKPLDAKMENIVQNTAEEEYKERDYVKLIYSYGEDELYTYKDVEKRFKFHQAKKIPIPNVPGIATPSGKLVLVLVEESIKKLAHGNIMDLVGANGTVKKSYKAASAKKVEKPVAKAKKPVAKKKKTAKKKAAKK